MKKIFLIESQYKKKSQWEDTDISDALYIGERRNFTIETYYVILTKALNDISDAGPIYYLTE